MRYLITFLFLVWHISATGQDIIDTFFVTTETIDGVNNWQWTDVFEDGEGRMNKNTTARMDSLAFIDFVLNKADQILGLLARGYEETIHSKERKRVFTMVNLILIGMTGINYYDMVLHDHIRRIRRGTWELIQDSTTYYQVNINGIFRQVMSLRGHQKVLDGLIFKVHHNNANYFKARTGVFDDPTEFIIFKHSKRKTKFRSISDDAVRLTHFFR